MYDTTTITTDPIKTMTYKQAIDGFESLTICPLCKGHGEIKNEKTENMPNENQSIEFLKGRLAQLDIDRPNMDSRIYWPERTSLELQINKLESNA